MPILPSSISKLAGNAIKSLLIRVGGVALTLGAYMLLARSMEEVEYGSFIYFVTWVGILSLLAQVGFSSSILRYFHEYESRTALLKGFVNTAIITSLLASLLLSGGVLLLHAGEFAPETLQNILPYLPLALFGFTLTYIAQAGLKADHRIILSQIFEQIGLPLTLLIFAIYGMMASISLSFFESVAVYSAVFALTAAITWALFLKRSYPRTEIAKYHIKSWLFTSLPMCGSSLVSALMSRLDIIMLGLFMGAADVGEYGVAARIAVLLSFLYAALNNALSPTISQKFQAGDMEAINRLIPKIMRIALALTVVGLVIVALLGGWVLSLFGEEYRSAAPLLLILSIAQAINLYAGPAGSVLLITGHQKAYLNFTLCFASLLAGGLWFAIPAYGLMGAASITLSVALLLNIALLITIRKLTGLRMI